MRGNCFAWAWAALLLSPAGVLAKDVILAQPDIPYVEPKSERRTMDLYWSADADDSPIVIWIHGGGFRTGSKADVDVKPTALAEHGFIFVAMNYRLMPEATIEEMAADVAKCVRRMHDRAKFYGGDPKSIILAGHSAGAQLAALVATDERYLKAEGLSLSVLRACIPVDGRYSQARGGVDSVTAPAKYVAGGKNIPPFLILYHDLGKPESGAQSKAFAELLQRAGVTAEVFAAKGKDHTTINRDLGTAGDPATDKMWKFLEETLKAPSDKERR